MTLGERLSQYRINAKMSQDVLAEKMGVTRQTISKWETDQSTPEFNKILPLCEIYGITTDELIKGEKSNISEGINDNEANNKIVNYNQKRNKKKAIIISISVFLYCIGMFSFPYMVENLNYSNSHASMISMTLWTIASVLLIYFFISNPKQKTEQVKDMNKEIKENNSNVCKIKDEEQQILNSKVYEVNETIQKSKVEIRIIQIIALLFLLAYITISFTTMQWHITWILWIVFIIVELITKLIFDLRRQKNGK